MALETLGRCFDERLIKNNYIRLILEDTFHVNRYILSPSRLNVVFDISRMLLLSK